MHTVEINSYFVHVFLLISSLPGVNASILLVCLVQSIVQASSSAGILNLGATDGSLRSAVPVQFVWTTDSEDVEQVAAPVLLWRD